MISAWLLLPLARDYSDHVGIPLSDERLSAGLWRRLTPMPLWGRALCCLGACLLRWVAPALFKGTLCGWSRLTTDERDEVLEAALRLSSWPLRGAILACRAVLLETVYAPEAA